MKRLKQGCIYLLILAVLSAGAALLFRDLGAECVSVLQTGRGGADYFLTASGEDGNMYALGRRDGRYVIAVGDENGRRLAHWDLTAEGLPARSRPAALYAASGGAVYLGLYDTQAETAKLQIFRITDRGRSAELLLNETCAGATLTEQMAGTRLSAFSEVDSVVTFAVLDQGGAQFYRRTGAASGLELGERAAGNDLTAALALPDGSVLTASGGTLRRSDRGERSLAQGAVITELLRAGTGVYCVDGASLKVFYADYADWQPYPILDLEKDGCELDRCMDLTVTRSGAALLLMEDGQLLTDRGGGLTDLSGMLFRPAWQCALILAGLALGVLAVSGGVWYAVCGRRRLQLALLVRWGVLTAAAAALAAGGLARCWAEPAAQAAGERSALELIETVAALELRSDAAWDGGLAVRLGGALAAAEDGMDTDCAVSVYERRDGAWYLTESNTAVPAGTRAELSGGYRAALAGQAGASGRASQLLRRESESRALCCWTDGGRMLTVDADISAAVARSRAESGWMSGALGALAALMTALALACLCAVTSGVRRVSRGMTRLTAGERGVSVRLDSGDELAALADSFTALSRTMEDMERDRSSLAESYRRFVPERVLSLLGKTSIQEVDKQTVVCRELAAMTISFSFPDEVYEKSGRELFDYVNEILERTAPIVTRSGGAVFNFAYDGYDAVFEGGSAAAVSTAVAVQQETLEINRRREERGEPPVTLRIALDEGSVMIGVVGDETQIEPTSISSSFSAARHLVALCGQLQASILCTEKVIAGAEGYGSRYMGKLREGGALIRTYEIFDGDPYEVRKLKEQTGGQFSEGVYALYAQDFSGAKRIFLKLVHQNADDGGARYYLYLADRLEKHPETEISLDPDR